MHGPIKFLERGLFKLIFASGISYSNINTKSRFKIRLNDSPGGCFYKNHQHINHQFKMLDYIQDYEDKIEVIYSYIYSKIYISFLF